MYKEITGKIIFFILDFFLLWGMFVFCEDVFHMQYTFIKILISNIAAGK